MQPRIEAVAPLPHQLWQSAFAANAGAPPSLSPGWSDALARHRAVRDGGLVYVFASGRRLLLPLVVGRGTPLGRAAASWPDGWGYGGVLVDGGGRPREDELAAVLRHLRKHRYLRAQVTPDPLAAEWGPAARRASAALAPHRSQFVDLDGGYSQVSRRFVHSVVRELRKAERSGVEIVSDRRGQLLPAFTDLYDRAVLRWGADRGQPPWLATRLARWHDRPGQLRAVYATCQQDLTLWGAVHAGEPVAVYAVLSHGERAWEWLGGVDLHRARETGATALLLANILEHESGLGRRWLDLGESDPGSGVEERKKRFGAQIVEFHSLTMERAPLTPATALARSAAAGMLRKRSRWGRGGSDVSAPHRA